VIIFPTKDTMSISLLTFRFCSFVTIRSESWLREFGTLVLLVVVARMLLLWILGFFFLLDYLGFVKGSCSADHSNLHKIILLSNQSITKGIKRGIFISSLYSFSGGIEVDTNTEYALPSLERTIYMQRSSFNFILHSSHKIISVLNLDE
jgi:hypothetical protein